MFEHDVLVRGTGAVGLAAGLALSRQGLRVAVQGQAPLHARAVNVLPADGAAPIDAGAVDVRAFALNAASVSLLSKLKVWDALPPSARTRVTDMHIEGDKPGAVLEFSAWSQGVTELAWIVDAPALEMALRNAATYAPHLSLLGPEQPAPPVALQVLAEGKASTTRHALGVQWTRHAYGHSAIAARLACDSAHVGRARQWFLSPDVLALLPLDTPQPGASYALVWSLPEARAQALMAMDDAAFQAELMQATAGAAGTLTLASARSNWPLSLAQASSVHGAGWVLVGDAAHVVHPLAGQGMNLGFADVAALADVLAQREEWRPLGDPRLLARYARQRWMPTRAMAQVTDGLLNLFAAPGETLGTVRNLGLSMVDRLGPLKRLLVSRALGA